MEYVWTVLWSLGGLALSLGVIVVVLRQIGKGIPVEHTATSVINIHAPIEKIFDAIADVEKHPEWSSGVTRVIAMPDTVRGGVSLKTTWMQMGHNTFVLERTRYEPPTLLEGTITDEKGPFSGTWMYRLKPLAADASGVGACEVRLTETGRVGWPMARALMKHVWGYHTYTHKHLESLAKKFEPNPGKARKG